MIKIAYFISWNHCLGSVKVAKNVPTLSDWLISQKIYRRVKCDKYAYETWASRVKFGKLFCYSRAEAREHCVIIAPFNFGNSLYVEHTFWHPMRCNSRSEDLSAHFNHITYLSSSLCEHLQLHAYEWTCQNN